MKKLLTIVTAVLLTASAFLPRQAGAQAPQKISYQAVIRNSEDALVTNTQVGMQISILQDSETGSAVYVETQTPTTNPNGLVSLEIGAGTPTSGDFSAIDWANGSYFIKTETDPAGGTDYTITGTSQLLSVPYALHANEVDPSVPQGTQAGQMQYWDGSAWATVAPGSEGEVLTFVSGVPTWKDSGNNGEVGEGDVQNPTTGKIWMDRNLGASQVATSGTDEDAYGDLYQWGRGTDGHEKRTSGTTSTLSSSDTPGHGDFILALSEPYDWRSPGNDDLWQGVNGINNPCPTGYRIPTEVEFAAERASWSSDDATGAFTSPLKFTLAGCRLRNDGSFVAVGSYGSYWSSTVDGTESRYLDFSGWYAAMYDCSRSFGNSVRCIKD